MNESKRINPKIISIIVIVLIAAASTGVYAATQSANKSDETATTSSQTVTSDRSDSTSSEETPSNAAATTYKDGSYTETGNYITPGGGESLTVTVTLANGTITDVSATGSANTGDSKGYQTQFLNGYKSQVVGKSVDEVKLSRVSGSSLTSGGFNSALTKIKEDASA